jgi:hypothetical protein
MTGNPEVIPKPTPKQACARVTYELPTIRTLSDHNTSKALFLLKIYRVQRNRSYLPTGTLHRSSSKKFSRKGAWFCVFCASAVSTGINATFRFPSGVRDHGTRIDIGGWVAGLYRCSPAAAGVCDALCEPEVRVPFSENRKRLSPRGAGANVLPPE